MKNLFIVSVIAVSSASVAQQDNSDTVYIKAFNDQYACVNADAVRLCDEAQKTAFIAEKTANGYALKTIDGSYVVAMEKTDACENNSGEIRVVQSKDGNAFAFECQDGGAYAIKSIERNTFVRANLVTGALDQTDSVQGWEKFSLMGFEPTAIEVPAKDVDASQEEAPKTSETPVRVAQGEELSSATLFAATAAMGVFVVAGLRYFPPGGNQRR